MATFLVDLTCEKGPESYSLVTKKQLIHILCYFDTVEIGKISHVPSQI